MKINLIFKRILNGALGNILRTSFGRVLFLFCACFISKSISVSIDLITFQFKKSSLIFSFKNRLLFDVDPNKVAFILFSN